MFIASYERGLISKATSNLSAVRLIIVLFIGLTSRIVVAGCSQATCNYLRLYSQLPLGLSVEVGVRSGPRMSAHTPCRVCAVG